MIIKTDTKMGRNFGSTIFMSAAHLASFRCLWAPEVHHWAAVVRHWAAVVRHWAAGLRHWVAEVRYLAAEVRYWAARCPPLGGKMAAQPDEKLFAFIPSDTMTVLWGLSATAGVIAALIHKLIHHNPDSRPEHMVRPDVSLVTANRRLDVFVSGMKR